jgi:hypothetical protein
MEVQRQLAAETKGAYAADDVEAAVFSVLKVCFGVGGTDMHSYLYVCDEAQPSPQDKGHFAVQSAENETRYLRAITDRILSHLLSQV